MDGVLLVHKPAGMTSHDVVNRIRKIFHTKKVDIVELWIQKLQCTGIMYRQSNEGRTVFDE